MSDFNYDGVHNLERDNPGQIEFNRRKNVEQDQRLNTLTSQVNELITQVPAGFLPRLYYALTRGEQKFRFIIDQEFGIENIPGNVGDAFELVSPMESQNYIPAVATKISATAIKIIIQGDYNLNVDAFNLINMATGDILSVTLPNALALQNASYLGDFDAQNSKGKQVTVLYDIETNEQNVIFASVDFSGDGVYNWIRIGGYVNGVSGKNIFGVTLSNIEAVSHVAVVGDLLLAGAQFNYGNIYFNIGDLAEVTGVNPLSIVYRGNIRGEQGAQGPAGATGATGQNGLTPRILNGTWWLGDEDTGVKALGLDGTNGQNGQSFLIQSGLYSEPNNLNNPNNVGPNGETLQQLPTLPFSDISGKAYIVFDPITTPLNPYYDLYFSNNGDSNWTIIHPFTGLKGQDGRNGFTPYIQGNNWYINGQNTGVSATGPQGPQGDKGLNPMGNWIAENEYYVDDLVTYNGSSYLCINNHSGVTTPPNTDTLNWLLFTAKGDTGPQGPTGATGATGPRGPAGATGAVATVVQTTGTDTGSVMSQNAVTTELEKKAMADASNLTDENVTSWREKLSISGGISLKEIINVTCSNLVNITASAWIETPIIYDSISKHAGGNLLSYDNSTGKIKIPANSGYSFVKITSNGSAQMTQTNTNTNWVMGIHATVNESITNLSTYTIPYIPSNGGTATSPYTIIAIADVDQDNDTYIYAYFANGYNANNKFVKGTNLTIECY